jgi:hypothetical protein
MMQVEPEVILQDLKTGKNSRSQASLEKLNTLLRAHHESGEKDFCIATIGRLSKKQGGISTVSIRNKTGEHFRRMIEAWATKANTTMKKPPVPHSRQREIPTDNQLLARLEDPAMRVIFGQIIAERNKMKSENRILKQQAEVIIDMRPNQVIHQPLTEHQKSVEVRPPLEGVLLNVDIEALKDAIDEDKLARRGWSVTKYGAVKDEDGRPLFKNGFVLGIEKVLAQV